MKTIEFDVSVIKTRKNLHEYLKNELNLPDYYGNNLDALADSLYELNEEYQIIFGRDEMKAITRNSYAYNMYKILQQAANEGLNIKIILK